MTYRGLAQRRVPGRTNAIFGTALSRIAATQEPSGEPCASETIKQSTAQEPGDFDSIVICVPGWLFAYSVTPAARHWLGRILFYTQFEDPGWHEATRFLRASRCTNSFVDCVTRSTA